MSEIKIYNSIQKLVELSKDGTLIGFAAIDALYNKSKDSFYPMGILNQENLGKAGLLDNTGQIPEEVKLVVKKCINPGETITEVKIISPVDGKENKALKQAKEKRDEMHNEKENSRRR